MKTILALLALLALLPTLAFGATATSTCIPDDQVLNVTGGDIVIFDVSIETAACAVSAARIDPNRVYLVSNNLLVTQALSKLLPDSGRIIAVGPAMTAAGLAAEINAAIEVVLHELDDENDEETSDALMLDTGALIAALARNYGWRVL